MNVTKRLFFIGLILCIPIVSVLGAQNIVCRAPDFYTYQFNKMQITEKHDIRIKENELGKHFSNFMIGKESKFENIEDGKDETHASFNANEGFAMEKVRYALNISLFILIGAFVIAVLSYFILRRDDKKEAIRAAFKLSWIFYVILWLFFGIAIFLPLVSNKLFAHNLLINIGEDSLLANLITKNVLADCYFLSIFVSAIIMGIIGSIIWRTTRQKMMFS